MFGNNIVDTMGKLENNNIKISIVSGYACRAGLWNYNLRSEQYYKLIAGRYSFSSVNRLLLLLYIYTS